MGAEGSESTGHRAVKLILLCAGVRLNDSFNHFYEYTI